MRHMMHKMVFKVIPTCKKAMEMQSRALDGELGMGKRMLINVHVMMCKFCRRYGNQIKQVKEFTEKFPDHGQFEIQTPMPEEARERIRGRFEEAKANPEGKSEN